MPKIAKKTFKQLIRLISEVISLNRVQEFEDGDKLFEDPPDCWEDMERQLCDYQARISGELREGAKKLFGVED
jgi:hypothetical protein